jgi:hypothetical protein
VPSKITKNRAKKLKASNKQRRNTIASNPRPAKRAQAAGAGLAKRGGGRFRTNNATRTMVWIRAAGHCELCGKDLTGDLRVGNKLRFGEAAHVLPASVFGPRAEATHDSAQAARLTNDLDNLVLACPTCHKKIDNDATGYSKEDLTNLHHAYLDRIRLAAKAPSEGRAVPLIFLSHHFCTRNDIPKTDLLRAMVAEGLWAVTEPRVIELPQPPLGGRDKAYWEGVTSTIQRIVEEDVRRHSTFYGDGSALAIAGLADIPALMMLGQAVGDRSKRAIFSPNRETGLRWPDLHATPPAFRYSPPLVGDGPLALVFSLSAKVPRRDVLKALPGARIAEITVDQPSTSMVKNRGVIHAFREALQGPLSELEAATEAAIRVFAAIPAALAIEFGAFLTMQHGHPYVVFDRDDHGDFQEALRLGYHKDPSS